MTYIFGLTLEKSVLDSPGLETLQSLWFQMTNCSFYMMMMMMMMMMQSKGIKQSFWITMQMHSNEISQISWLFYAHSNINWVNTSQLRTLVHVASKNKKAFTVKFHDLRIHMRHNTALPNLQNKGNKKNKRITNM